MKEIIVKLTPWDRKKAERFADQRWNSIDVYKKRGSFKREDIVNGALAEIAAYKTLCEVIPNLSKPDFKIYERGQKSYDADLHNAKYHFHIKGQPIDGVRKYGASWLMQRTDPIVKNPEKNHYLVTCAVDAGKNEVIILAAPSVLLVEERDCFGDCSIEWFNKYKTAIDLHNIEMNMSKKERWGLLYTSGR